MAEQNSQKTITLKLDASLYKENLKLVIEENKKADETNKKLLEGIDKINKAAAQSAKTINGLRGSMSTLKEISVKDLSTIASTTIHLQSTINQLVPLNDKILKSYEKTNKTALEALNTEIEASKVKTDELNKLVEAHKMKDSLLREQSEIAKRRVEEEYKQVTEKAELSAEQLVLIEEDKTKRIALIDGQLKQTLEQNVKDLQTNVTAVRGNMLDELTKEAQETAKHTGGLWKGVIDVGATKEQYDIAIDSLKNYQQELKDAGKNIEDSYDEQIKNAEGNMESVAALEQEKADAVASYSKFEKEEVKRVTTEIAKLEKSGQHLRLDQWQAYAEKVSEISQQVSERTAMVTNSLGDMFGQMAESYQQEVESLNEKIAAVDEEKELALADIALTEDERQIREEELAQQKIMLENATSEEQKLKAQERIATLQNELTSEDVISKEYDKKKEEQAKDAEKMKKRMEMGQAIVEAIGNVAAGAAKALSFGPFLGPVLAAIVAAAGAVQIGIMTKQLAQMEDGGLLRGKRHRNGGMPILGSNIEVEGGEYVVNRESTGKNLGLISHINSQRRSLSPADISDFFGSQGRVHEPSFGRMFREGGQLPVMERMPNLIYSK